MPWNSIPSPWGTRPTVRCVTGSARISTIPSSARTASHGETPRGRKARRRQQRKDSIGSMEIASASTYKAPDNYSWRDVNNELVVLNLQSGEYFTFNNVGRLIWLSVNDGKTVDEVTRSVMEQYATTEEKAVADVKAFIGNLLSEGLLIPL